MKKWNRSLGTSKREQGVITPKRPPLLRTMARYREDNKEREFTMQDFIEALKRRQ
jgi:hypothetical protein